MSMAASNAMKTLASWAPAPNPNVIAVQPGEPDWRRARAIIAKWQQFLLFRKKPKIDGESAKSG
jgi:hypothetical protein